MKSLRVWGWIDLFWNLPILIPVLFLLFSISFHLLQSDSGRKQSFSIQQWSHNTFQRGWNSEFSCHTGWLATTTTFQQKTTQVNLSCSLQNRLNKYWCMSVHLFVCLSVNIPKKISPMNLIPDFLSLVWLFHLPESPIISTGELYHLKFVLDTRPYLS